MGFNSGFKGLKVNCYLLLTASRATNNCSGLEAADSFD